MLCPQLDVVRVAAQEEATAVMRRCKGSLDLEVAGILSNLGIMLRRSTHFPPGPGREFGSEVGCEVGCEVGSQFRGQFRCEFRCEFRCVFSSRW